MINVILGSRSSCSFNDYNFPVFDEQGRWCGMSTAHGDDGNGRMDKPWCSFAHDQTWVNTETNESIILINEFFTNNNSWGLNEYGMEEFKRLLRSVDELELDSEMPDIF